MVDFPCRNDGTSVALAGEDRLRMHHLDHDIRSALSDVLGGLALLDSGTLPPGARLQLDRVSAAASALNGLCEEMASHVAGGDGPAPDRAGAAATSLRDLIQGIERRWRGHAAAQGLTFRMDLACDLPAFVGLNAQVLERILSNLLSNAMKHGLAGTVTLWARLAPCQTLILSVEDEGPGFPSPAQAVPLANRPGAAPGSGLGLRICQDLADRIGARLSIGNRPQGGACVALEIPREAWRPGGIVVKQASLAGRRILLADDSPTNQLLFERMLLSMGARTRVVEDGASAIALLERETFDIALVDIDLPMQSGIEVIRHLRRLSEPRNRTPVIAVTAHARHGICEQIRRAGADEILVKPILNAEIFGQAVARQIALGCLSGGPGADLPEDHTANLGSLDVSRLRELLDLAGPDLRGELLSRLTSDLRRAQAGLRQAVGARDLDALRRQAHVLVALSGTVGAEGLARLARRLNAGADRGRDPDSADTAQLVDRAIAAILHQMAALSFETEGSW